MITNPRFNKTERRGNFAGFCKSVSHYLEVSMDISEADLHGKVGHCQYQVVLDQPEEINSEFCHRFTYI